MSHQMSVLAALILGLATSAQAQSTSEILEQFGFSGTWSPRCDQAPSPQNGLRRITVTPAGRVRFRESFGKLYRENVYDVLGVAPEGSDRLTIRARLNGRVTQDLVIVREDDRMRIVSNRLVDGKNAGTFLVHDGTVAASGAPTPWMTRCR
jgi:hypothetical protein